MVIINMDEDNRALKADYDFPQKEVLLSNYDFTVPSPVTGSVTLRPYEIRILKL